MEIWKDVKGYEGIYLISNIGRVKRIDCKNTQKERILKNCKCNGYYGVSLSKNGAKSLELIHRLVAEAFIPNPENKPCIDHINTIKSDNRVENLRWVTYKENSNNPLTKKNISTSKKAQNRRGVNSKLFGTKVKQEVKEKISKSHKGKKLSEETKRKLSEINKGNKHKEETKIKISKSLTGSKNVNSVPVVQLTPNGEFVKIYDCISETGRNGFTAPNVSKCCRGLRKYHKGYMWKYLEEYLSEK